MARQAAEGLTRGKKREGGRRTRPGRRGTSPRPPFSLTASPPPPNPPTVPAACRRTEGREGKGRAVGPMPRVGAPPPPPAHHAPPHPHGETRGSSPIRPPGRAAPGRRPRRPLRTTRAGGGRRLPGRGQRSGGGGPRRPGRVRRGRPRPWRRGVCVVGARGDGRRQARSTAAFKCRRHHGVSVWRRRRFPGARAAAVAVRADKEGRRRRERVGRHRRTLPLPHRRPPPPAPPLPAPCAPSRWPPAAPAPPRARPAAPRRVRSPRARRRTNRCSCAWRAVMVRAGGGRDWGMRGHRARHGAPRAGGRAARPARVARARWGAAHDNEDHSRAV